MRASGTGWRTSSDLRGALLSAGLIIAMGCADDEPAVHDSASVESADAAVSACDQAFVPLRAFIAQHDRCVTSGECGLLGGCNPPFWVAVTHVEAARPLYNAVTAACAQQFGFDGPINEATCGPDGRCATRATQRWCGQIIRDAGL